MASCKNFNLEDTAGGSLTGLLAVFDEFKIEKSPATATFAFTGRVITEKFYIKEREPWETLHWDDYYDAFIAEYPSNLGTVLAYFPMWMNAQGYSPVPKLTVKPDSTPVTYHWSKGNDPVYVPHDDDEGLRWDMIDWRENP